MTQFDGMSSEHHPLASPSNSAFIQVSQRHQPRTPTRTSPPPTTTLSSPSSPPSHANTASRSRRSAASASPMSPAPSATSPTSPISPAGTCTPKTPNPDRPGIRCRPCASGTPYPIPQVAPDRRVNCTPTRAAGDVLQPRQRLSRTAWLALRTARYWSHRNNVETKQDDYRRSNTGHPQRRLGLLRHDEGAPTKPGPW